MPELEIVTESRRGTPSFDPATLPAMSGEELDALPFGVIEVDRAGVILQYNLAEARFARLDRADVIGKSFFGRIAPCTDTPAFRGRFDELLRDRRPSTRFSYTFDFRFGAQEVEVEIVRASRAAGAGERYFFLIDRRKFLPPRRDVPDLRPAPAQKELAPRDEKLGVVRDAAERRIVQATPIFLEALASAHDKHAEATPFLDAWGFAWGRRAAIDLETEVLESFDKVLRELPMVTVAEVIAQYVRRQGLGQMTVDFTPAKQGVFVVQIERSAFACAVAPGSRGPRCRLFEGFLRALFSHLAHRPLVVREVECAALGAERCELIVAGEQRAQAIEGAVANARTTGRPGTLVSQLLRALVQD